jgi:hypothetical protein
VRFKAGEGAGMRRNRQQRMVLTALTVLLAIAGLSAWLLLSGKPETRRAEIPSKPQVGVQR